MFRIEKKVVFPFIRCGLFDPEGLSPFQWVRTLGHWNWIDYKVEAPWSAPTGKCSASKKGGLSFYSMRVI
ncbi:hypothetical protein ACQCVP_20300 [Rossellomorea vietnamensis]|uniref:hypothetical protein n=1 Tax=Rossellomorea vietnamensis TaxID=218284 RepID=UPI003CF0738D